MLSMCAALLLSRKNNGNNQNWRTNLLALCSPYHQLIEKCYLAILSVIANSSLLLGKLFMRFLRQVTRVECCNRPIF